MEFPLDYLIVIMKSITTFFKKKERKGKKYSGSARFDPGAVTSYLKTLPQSNKAFSK